MIVLALALVLAASSAAASAAPSPSPPNCNANEYRQLDFWVGQWEVFDTAGGYQVGTSTIERVMGGCAIRESYTAPKAPGGPYSGTSLSSFDRKDGRWHQTYVDTNGSLTQFTGGAEGKALAMTAPGLRGALQRMTYTPLPDGSVTQVGTTSNDEGKNWQPGYDYTYRRATR
ncbi:MAG: hypothetical protein ABIR87_03255 [Sphingomicrobium sp.]